jgi:hypothetical protein
LKEISHEKKESLAQLGDAANATSSGVNHG